MCNQCEENELKLQIIGIFLSLRAITLSKMAQLYQNKLDLDILMINLYTKFYFNTFTQKWQKRIFVEREH